MTSRYFYDTEFIEDGRTVDLISIGIVAEDGRELYLVNRDAPWGRIKKHEWLMANVVPHLPQPHGDWILDMPKSWPIDLNNRAVKPHAVIAEEVKRFILGDDFVRYADVELWADYGAYDHVVLCQLFGRMVDLPPGMPMFTHDLQQMVRGLGEMARSAMPAQESGQHDALADARHLANCYHALKGRSWRRLSASTSTE